MEPLARVAREFPEVRFEHATGWDVGVCVWDRAMGKRSTLGGGKLRLTDLALSPGHLTTVVRRKTGRTVQQWIAQRRMQQARLLLTGTDLTVAAISRRVGYPDAGYFIRRFRAEHRLTPAQWRARA